MAEHAGDLLSALLDGQLSVREATLVRAHVADCDECARELEHVRDARRLVRGLPAVDVPSVFLAELSRDGAGDAVVPLGRRTTRRPPIGSIAASIAAGVLLLVLSSSTIGPGSLEPEVDGALARHASTVSALFGSSGERLTPLESVPATTSPPRSVDDLPPPYDVPARLAGYDLVDAYRSPGGLHVLYQRGAYGLSVFELPGSVDWDTLPSDGTRLELAGHDAWRWDGPPANGRVVVLEDDQMVMIVVGDELGSAVLDVAAALPGARDESMPTRMKRAVAKALELFSPLP